MTWTPTGEAYAIHRNLISSSTGIKNLKAKIAERGFDPRTSGLWAQHAPTAPLCWMVVEQGSKCVQKEKLNYGNKLFYTLITRQPKTFSN